jgi:putative hemolysin
MTSAAADETPAATLWPKPHEHIVDVLIAERAPGLTHNPLWPLIRPPLYRILGYGPARAMADAVLPLSGAAALDHVADLLDLKITIRSAERIPTTGRCVVVCNHPTGIADGVAAFDAIRKIRSDSIFFANADALRVSPRLGEAVIPVEWVESKRTREKTRATLLAAKEAFEADRCVVIFPAGRLARKDKDGQLTDPPWAPTAISLARKYDAPVVPIHVAGPDSRLYHFFNRFSGELRDVTLFHEMLNKRGKPFTLTVGKPIPIDRLEGDTGAVTLALKAFVERDLPANPDQDFA